MRLAGEGKGDNLFAVYVMRKKCKADGDGGGSECDGKKKVVRLPLVVRDGKGRWTKDYEEVMGSMSIPVV